MQRNQIGCWAVILLLATLFLSASKPEKSEWLATRTTKIYRVAIVPICNPGTYCDPGLPKKLGLSFFKLPNGVASFINEVSQGNAQIVGEALPWIRPKSRLKSSQELIARSEDLIELASSYVRPEDIDVFFFYARLSGAVREESWPSGQILRIGNKELKPGLVFILNSEIYDAPLRGKLQSALTPSVSWAREFLRSIGLRGNSDALNCQSINHLASCTIRTARDPFSLLGDIGFALAPNWPIQEALSWSLPSAAEKVQRNGSYQLDFGTGSRKALVIKLPAPLHLNASTHFDQLYIERKPVTRFDRTLRKLQPAEVRSHFDALLDEHERGAFLYFSSSTEDRASTVLIDANPNSPPFEQTPYGKSSLFAELADTQLLPGKTFQIFESPITVKITRATSTSLTVKVEGLNH